MASTTQARSVLANAIQHNHPPEAIAAARRELRAAVAEKFIRELAGSVPPLSPEQRSRLAVLLLDPAGGAVDAA